MHAFRATEDGLQAHLEPHERLALARCAMEVLGVLAGPDELAGEVPATRYVGSSAADAEVLSALDFDPTEDARHVTFGDPALERLIPVASRTDSEAATEFRRYTQRDLRDEKAARLMDVLQELEHPTGADGQVRVAPGAEGLWLAALTDLRLVLGVRLDIDTDEDAQRVTELALRVDGQDGEGREHDAEDSAAADRQYLATLYVALTWWQESLLESLGS